ncbi:hypothetical protein TsFJ059_006910 [Trichoderma semiorbis]|uniref:Uncharacterized protein n=1 Tax=Trichoderma semiorbis TaxID=1491008 RepID=A0A9P8HKX1_9HYPO|nr:hypothetical protein TsFJ059_006910 [Trichoderma semiorbis]
MDYYSEESIKLGYACSLVAKLILISENQPYYTEHDDYLAVAMLDLVASQPMSVFEEWLTFAEGRLRVVLELRLTKFIEEAKKAKGEQAQFSRRRMEERQNALAEEIEIADDYDSDDEVLEDEDLDFASDTEDAAVTPDDVDDTVAQEQLEVAPDAVKEVIAEDPTEAAQAEVSVAAQEPAEAAQAEVSVVAQEHIDAARQSMMLPLKERLMRPTKKRPPLLMKESKMVSRKGVLQTRLPPTRRPLSRSIEIWAGQPL